MTGVEIEPATPSTEVRWLYHCAKLLFRSLWALNTRKKQKWSNWFTWLSVTNSASTPTTSPSFNISVEFSGVKLRENRDCFRANDLSANNTLLWICGSTVQHREKMLQRINFYSLSEQWYKRHSLLKFFFALKI